MLNALNCAHLAVVENYIRAKDENKPNLMTEIFIETAILEVEVLTDTYFFLPVIKGLDLMTDALVININQMYDNIYTYCIVDKSNCTSQELSCKWLVCMNERESGNMHVLFGQYNWSFDGETVSPRATKLVLTIENMVVLPTEVSTQVADWTSGLSYPWCYSETIRQTMPNIDQLNVIRKSLA